MLINTDFWLIVHIFAIKSPFLTSSFGQCTQALENGKIGKAFFPK